MSESGSIKAHFILEDSGKVLARRFIRAVPRVDDEIRFGAEGEETTYRVTRVVWAFDEDCAWQRVNLGILEVA